VVNRVGNRRREIVGRIITQLDEDECTRLSEALERFATAAGDVPDRELWGVGWAG
jgi:hypothetical protein